MDKSRHITSLFCDINMRRIYSATLISIVILESSPGGGGALRWARRWWRALVAELVATALLVWLGVAAMVPVRGPDSVQLTHPALAFGFVVVACAMGCGPASGAHMNPAVTLAALVYGQLAPGAALGYALAQTAGATLGFGALLATTPAAAMRDSAGCTLPAPGVAPLAAAALEAAITGALALACCGAWAAHDPARPDHTVPVKLGLVVAGLIYSAGHATGASLNPARSFGAAVLQGEWRHHWVYWAGPLLGAALAALLHRFVLRVPLGPPAPHRSRTHTDADPDVELPLNDKP